jgi:hypothetical protein
MNQPIEITEKALDAFVRYARRERNIDRTEAMLTAVHVSPSQGQNIHLARIANLATLYLESSPR